MVLAFQRFLASLNHTSGRKLWRFVCFTGTMLIQAWLIAAMPWVDLFTGHMLGIGKFGYGSGTTVIIYDTYEIPSRTADYYFLAVLLSIAILKIGILLVHVGWNFMLGRIYVFTPGLGMLGGKWIKANPI